MIDVRELFIRYSRTYFLPQESEYLANGLVFGDDSQLSQTMKDLFRSLGVSHFTAASGANLQLFVPHFLRFVLFLRGHLLFQAIQAAGVAFYLSKTELSSSLWRATLFWIIGWLAQFIGRKQSFYWVLLSTLFLTLLFRTDFFGSLGFQLSFLCMIALRFSQALKICENTMREKTTSRVFLWVRESVRDSFCIFLFLTPLLFYRFGEVTAIGVISTPLLSPFIDVLTRVSVLSLWEVPYTDLAQQYVYSYLGLMFFMLQFAHGSVITFFLWLAIIVGTVSIPLRIRNQKKLWRLVP